jgi:hypothetical protein
MDLSVRLIFMRRGRGSSLLDEQELKKVLNHGSRMQTAARYV